MAAEIREEEIIAALHQVPRERWPNVLTVLNAMQSRESTTQAPIRTAADVLSSGIVGILANRDDVVDSQQFARHLREQAEQRSAPNDARH